MRIIYDNKIDALEATAITALTESTIYPVTNIQDQRLGVKYHTDTATTQSVIFEFDSVYDTPTTYIDNSGNGYDGTLSGFGPVASFFFDDDLTDEQGGASLTTVGTTVFETGVVGNGAGGASFQATGITPATVGSVSFWAKFDTLASSTSVFDSSRASANNIYITLDNASAPTAYDFAIRDDTDGNNYTVSGGTIIADTFQNIVITWNDGNVNFYVNKTNIGEVDAITAGWYPAQQLFILGGSYATTGQVNDDFRIYDYALSQAEIDALYDRPQQPSHWVDGGSGKTLAFNGASKVEIASGLPAGDISISLWFNAKEGFATKYLFAQDGGSKRVINMNVANFLVFSSRLADGTSVAQSFIPAESWEEGIDYHVVAIQDGLTTKIYLNGVLIDSDTHASIYTSFSATGRFGTFVSTSYYDGLLDEPRIYNRALTETEIKTLYAGNEISTAGLVVDYKQIIPPKINTAAILGHNIKTGATVKIEANDVNEWTSPPVSESMVINEDIILRFLADNYYYKYWRFSFTNAASLEIGRLWLGTYTDISPSSLAGLSVGKERSDDVVFGRNRQKFASVGVGWRTFDLSFPQTAGTGLSIIQTIYDTVGNHSAFIFCNFDTLRTADGDKYKIVEPAYVRIDGGIKFTHNRNMKFTYDITLEECK